MEEYLMSEFNIIEKSIVCLLSAFFLTCTAFGEGYVLPERINAVQVVTDTLAQAGLESESCSREAFDVPASIAQQSLEMQSTPLTILDGLVLTAVGKEFSQIDAFFINISKSLTCRIVSFYVKRNTGKSQVEFPIRFHCKLEIPVDEAEGSAVFMREIWPKLKSFVFFNPAESVKETPELFSIEYSVPDILFIQLIAKEPDDFKKVASIAGIPDQCRSISRNIIENQTVYTMEFSSEQSLLSSSVMTDLFKSFMQCGSIFEITAGRSPDAKLYYNARLNVKSPDLERLKNLFEKTSSLELLKCEIRPAQPDLSADPYTQGPSADFWTFALTFRPSSDAAFPILQVMPLLDSDLPGWCLDELAIRWTPAGLTLTTSVENESQVEELKPIVRLCGLEYKGLLKQESLAKNKLMVAFSTSAGDSSDYAIDMQDMKLGSYEGMGKVIDVQTLNNGERYTLEIGSEQIGELIEKLSADKNKSATGFTLDFIRDDRAKVVFTIIPGANEKSSDMLRLAGNILKSDLPLNCGESGLKDRAAVTGFKILSEEEFEVCGNTLKSGLVFSDLFPRLLKIPGAYAPFFKHGSYRDHDLGRIMKFEVQVKWNSKAR